MVKKVGKYEIGKTLGEGTFGKVKLATNSETGEKVAIKILDKEKIQKQNMGSSVKKEISIMKMIKHKHVVKLYEVLASRTKIFIVLELITGGELFDKIVAEGRFNEDTSRFYFRQLCTGVKYCHTQGVAHRDLKPENLLLDETSLLKISDFGLSALYTGGPDDGTSRATLLHTTCGTPNYVAPEVLNDRGYDGRAADVWSMGVILYVLLAGFLPFDEPHMSALFRKIQKAEFVYPSWFSTPVRSLLDKILVADPTKRYTLAQIMADPWYVSDDGGGEEGSGGAGGDARTMAATPSAKDVAEAVRDGVDVEEGKGGDADGPMALSAFDVCNMFGGMALNRMFLSSDERRIRRAPQFISNQTLPEIATAVRAALSTLGGTAEGDDHHIRAIFSTSHGDVRVIVEVFTMGESLHLVEILRGKGDMLSYNEKFAALREALAPLELPPAAGSS
mmetsp:Transcript_83543/g.202598  ORF Transcript_83543/g.202598 Transcript_83543/m.202598 type:complete len:448 (-) Transcript_83543:90-1433(-)